MDCEVFENRLCDNFLINKYLLSQKLAWKLRNIIVTRAKFVEKSAAFILMSDEKL